MRRQMDWSVGSSSSVDMEPAEPFPATVPGAVQLDYAHAMGWPPHGQGEEALRYRGLEDHFWHYRATLPSLPTDCRSRLVLRDVDHYAEVRLDGQKIGAGGGIGRDLIVPLDGAKTGSRLEVIVFPAPKEPGMVGRARALRTTKAAVGYGWDFHPDLIPLGIAGGAWIECLPPDAIIGLDLRARLAPDLSSAELRANVEILGNGEVCGELMGPDGDVVWSETVTAHDGFARFSARIETPRLWWPLGQGAQPLYQFRARRPGNKTVPGQAIRQTIGFRQARLTMAPGQWDEPSAFPKSRSRPPFSMEINGRRIFCKGANIVGPDIFPGNVGDARWIRIVARAAAAHMNLLRVWGGAASPPDVFFQACDEAGIMVVQEFPLGCNDYPDDPGYLAELEEVANALLSRLAPHPCRVLWSGGNELFNAWSGMTDQSHALRLLAARAWEQDPDTPFVPTLPIEGVGHGYYLFRDPKTGVECLELFQKSRNTGYTEFGVPGAAPMEIVRAILPPDDLWPPRPEGAWVLHSGILAWDVEPTSYLCLSTIEHYWGPQPDMGAVIEKSQWLQCEGQKAIIEEARRQRPFCGWALLWCLNEPWPTVANQSLLAYPDEPKPAYEDVRLAMRPTLASARIPKFLWNAGEMFSADLFVLHDAPEPRPAISVRAVLTSGDWRSAPFEWHAEAGPSAADAVGPTLRVMLPKRLGTSLVLELLTDQPALNSSYRFAANTPAEIAPPDGATPRGLNT